MIDLIQLEQDAQKYDFETGGAIVLALIQRLRKAEAERDRLARSEWIDGKTLADQAAEIRRLQNAIEVQVDLRAQLGLALDELNASRKVIAAARTVTETGGIPVALDTALDEYDGKSWVDGLIDRYQEAVDNLGAHLDRQGFPK